MIKYTAIPENIFSLLPKATDYLLLRKDVLFAYLFGSLAKGKHYPLSDVDIAVYLSKFDELIDAKMEILGNLIDLLETDEIDLVILNTASIVLRMRILENKKLILDNSPFQRHRFESITMREFFDFSIREMAIFERRFSLG